MATGYSLTHTLNSGQLGAQHVNVPENPMATNQVITVLFSFCFAIFPFAGILTFRPPGLGSLHYLIIFIYLSVITVLNKFHLFLGEKRGNVMRGCHVQLLQNIDHLLGLGPSTKTKTPKIPKRLCQITPKQKFSCTKNKSAEKMI